MTEYLKVAPLPSWWQELELKYLSISELFKELFSWNLESKLFTPKNITGTYFCAILAIPQVNKIVVMHAGGEQKIKVFWHFGIFGQKIQILLNSSFQQNL